MIKGEHINLQLRVSEIDLIESKLILVDRSRSPIFWILSSPELNELGRIGRFGKGPGEFLKGVKYFGQRHRTNDGIKGIWVFGMNDRKMKLVNLDQFASGKMKINKEIYVPRIMPFEHGLFYLNDTTMVGTSTYSVRNSYGQKRNKPLKGHFYVMNPVTSKIEWHPPFPEIKYNGWIDMGRIYKDHPKLKPDGSKIAAPNQYFSRIDIYSPYGERLICINYITPKQKLIIPEFSNQPWFDAHYFYYDCFVTDDYIYAHFVNIKGSDHYDSQHKSQIQVYDWDGNPVCLYITDTALDCIAVDEDNGIIYGGHDVTEGDLTVFHLKDSQKLNWKE